MTLKNTINYFSKLVSETSKKSEIRVYEEFIQLIISLEKKNLSETEIQSIENELDALNFKTTTGNNKKYFTRALTQFKKYLKDTFSLTTKGYFTNLGIALGLSFGAALGVVFLPGFERSLGISLGIGIGMLIGLIVGRYLDAQATVSGKVI